MKKTIGIIIAVIVVIIAIFAGTYNSLVSSQAAVEQKQADIDTQLKRRTDLIPNLVTVAKSYAAHETEVFDAVNKARENLMGAGTMQEKAAADDQLTSALGKFVAIAENYPELKLDTVYVDLTDKLAGTENRISTARTNYNEAVKDYNTGIRSFPKNIFAGMFGFEKAEYFTASEADQEPVTVDLENK